MSEEKAITLKTLARQAKGLDQRVFCARFPSPVLVLQRPGALGLSESRVDTPPPGGVGPDGSTTTAVASGRPLMDISLTTPSPDDEDDSLVHFVRKTDRNPFTGMITIGRARNNDIVIGLPTISKVHAYVTQRGDGFHIFDQGSTNGTLVDGRKLEAQKGTRLEDGATVVLAPGVALRFYAPTALFGLLALRSSLGSK